MILIVDDDESIVLLLKKHLEKNIKERVESVSSAEAALKAISGDLDLLLLDVNLPKMNGIDLCKLIRQKKEYGFLPIIMITASDDKEVLNHAFAAGATDFLSKPINKNELIARVKVALTLSQEMKRRICYEGKLERVLKNALIQVNAINAAANGIVILEGEKKIVWSNKAAARLLGCTNKDLVGIKLKATKLTSLSQADLDYMWVMATQGKVARNMLKLRGNSGYLWLEASLSPVKNRHGRYEHYVLILQDVTAQELTRQKEAMDIDLARNIQRSLFPNNIHLDGLSIEGFAISAEKLGGDLYYWHRHEDGILVILSADIMGHGIASALISMLVRAILPDLMHRSKSALDIIQHLNLHIKSLWQDDADEFFFVTGICLVIDPASKTVSYVNAGHPGGIAMIDHQLLFLSKGTLPMGLIEKSDIQEGCFSFDKIQLLLFSDGIYEIMDNNIDLTHQHLINTLNSNISNKIGQIKSEITTFCTEKEMIPDDVSVIYLNIE